eukprot:NODE_679_length_2469_cov_36.761722_g584_i0.p1 GENE.NODE_679_length_2469_cov_36.761722_g584_i0~~NODE_679_length_2469_cov_36.761722_g584_i0.p1  ORF type:complete len:444 (+),score=80.93 NODE_679_length_2469_cov_36.761722_g584_i0:54-1385(+)
MGCGKSKSNDEDEEGNKLKYDKPRRKSCWDETQETQCLKHKETEGQSEDNQRDKDGKLEPDKPRLGFQYGKQNDSRIDPDQVPGRTNQTIICNIQSQEIQCPEKAIQTLQNAKSSSFDVNPDLSDGATSGIGSWTIVSKLGAGAFGEVFLTRSEAGLMAAVKVIRFDNVDPSGYRKIALVQRELKMLKTIPKHLHVVRYYTSRARGPRVFIFMEYCPGGSLRQRYQRYGAPSMDECRQWTRHILLGLQFLHSHSVAHRDIKCDNVLLDLKGNAKLADFGAATVLTEVSQRSFIGSVHWMAPEVAEQKGHNWRADIWSVGCTLMEMMTATHPFKQLPTVASALLFLSSTQPVDIQYVSNNEMVINFLEQCLQRNAVNRPDCTTLLYHPLVDIVVKGTAITKEDNEKSIPTSPTSVPSDNEDDNGGDTPNPTTPPTTNPLPSAFG